MYKVSIILLSLIFCLPAFCQQSYEVMVLGTSQDGGYPQYNCSKACCLSVWQGENDRHFVSSLAIIDKDSKDVWLIDCTPDIKDQINLLFDYFNNEVFQLRGIFLTHAHIGHYTGLMNLGREVSGSKGIPVFVMPKMKDFLENNGPWNQLIELENIVLQDLSDGLSTELSESLSITVFSVPHRDEYSETVGFSVCGNEKTLTYIPDIDKWSKWNKDIKEVVSNSTYALLDGTFYSSDELQGRDMADIPHPSVNETMNLFKTESSEVKRKIFFTHLNHSNPLHLNSGANEEVKSSNFNVAEQGQIFELSKKKKDSPNSNYFKK